MNLCSQHWESILQPAPGTIKTLSPKACCQILLQFVWEEKDLFSQPHWKLLDPLLVTVTVQKVKNSERKCFRYFWIHEFTFHRAKQNYIVLNYGRSAYIILLSVIQYTHTYLKHKNHDFSWIDDNVLQVLSLFQWCSNVCKNWM